MMKASTVTSFGFIFNTCKFIFTEFQVISYHKYGMAIISETIKDRAMGFSLKCYTLTGGVHY